jgi:hypothetical protein
MVDHVYVCIGNGVREDGTPSAISRAIANKAIECITEYPGNGKRCCVLLCGGFRNPHGVTEAGAMETYLTTLFQPLIFRTVYPPFLLREDTSYRTHMNAIEVLKVLNSQLNFQGSITIIDHPAHIERTMLAFRAVNRVHYRNYQWLLDAIPTEEVWDGTVYHQPYWVGPRTWWPRERKMQLLYSVLLSRPWTRLGLWFLKTVWPSEKQ